MQALSREARSNQRRLLTAFGIDTDSDLLKFNQLKVRLYYFYIVNLERMVSFGCITELSDMDKFVWHLSPFTCINSTGNKTGMK